MDDGSTPRLSRSRHTRKARTFLATPSAGGRNRACGAILAAGIVIMAAGCGPLAPATDVAPRDASGSAAAATASTGSAAASTGTSAPASSDASATGTGRAVGTDAIRELGFTPEDPSAASVKVTAEAGGTLSATGSDGTRFTLTIPPGAVDADVVVRMVPLTAITGAGRAPVVAARFEPDGQSFSVPARLVVRPASEIPAPERFLFVADHDGGRVRPAFMDPAQGEATLYLWHFSMAGEAGVNDSALDGTLGVAKADRADAILDEIAGVIQRGARSGARDDPLAQVANLLDTFDKEITLPAMDAWPTQPNRCSNVEHVLDLMIQSGRQRAILGLRDSVIDFGPRILAAKAGCEREAVRRCKQQRQPARLLEFWFGWSRQLQLLGLEDSTPTGLPEKAEQICLPQRYDANGGGGGVTITGTIPDLSRPFMLTGTGDGFVVHLSYTPSDDTGRSGTMTYEGSGGGLVMAGKATYAVIGDEGGPLVLNQTGEGCVDVYCAATTEVLILTPISS